MMESSSLWNLEKKKYIGQRTAEEEAEDPSVGLWGYAFSLSKAIGIWVQTWTMVLLLVTLL